MYARTRIIGMVYGHMPNSAASRDVEERRGTEPEPRAMPSAQDEDRDGHLDHGDEEAEIPSIRKEP
jgi:hypothetical protein